MSDMLLEINEELRHQQLKAFWARFGQWIIGFAISAVLATGMATAWKYYLDNTLSEQMNEILSTMDEKNDISVKERYERLSKQSTSVSSKSLQGLLRLKAAQLAEADKNFLKASEEYEAVMNLSGIDKAIKDLAQLNRSRIGLLQNEDVQKISDILSPLLKKDSPYYFSAQEIKAILLIKQDKKNEANVILNQLSNDALAPATLRDRARTLMN